ncbi:MAG: hypothetical protein ABEJ26_06270 [Halosimplex sp.]
MSKVSIGLRGWRFDEAEVFAPDGSVRDVTEMSEDTRNRLLRLSALLGEPCSACWLVHGEADLDRCNTGEVVYGEVLAEVLLCPDHEPDFVYWFREAGGSEYAGRAALQDEFYEWFADGNRAPEGYEGVEHVDRDPEGVPDPMAADSLDEVAAQAAAMDQAEREALDVDLDDLDV